MSHSAVCRLRLLPAAVLPCVFCFFAPLCIKLAPAPQKALGELGKRVRLTGYRLQYRRTHILRYLANHFSAGSHEAQVSAPAGVRRGTPRPPWWRARYAWAVRSRWRCSGSRMPVLAPARPASAHWRAERGDAACRKAPVDHHHPQGIERASELARRSETG